AIDEAKDLATRTINVLNVKGAETSISYDTWFGSSNADPATKEKIINLHYKTVLSHLPNPDIPVAFRYTTHAEFKAPIGQPPPTLDSLVYGCPPPNDKVCADRTMASNIQAFGVKEDGTTQDIGPRVLVLCPIFFDLKSTNEEMLKNWQQTLSLSLHNSKGRVLVHEVQHMDKATSPDPAADDLPESIPDFFGNDICYSPGCCARLPNRDKMKNAQNFALFAVDVLAFPDAGKPASS
ncbi:hypothetical protein LZ30DRAFT_539810, partial [Colletotrichum cereale]